MTFRHHSIPRALGAPLALLVLLACNSTTGTEDVSLFEALGQIQGLATFASVAETAGLEDALQDEGPFTIFAPTDAAFDALPADFRASLLENQTTAFSVAGFHIVVFSWTRSELQDGMSLATVTQQNLVINLSDGGIRVNGEASVTQTDLFAQNGVIHVLNGVLLPPGVVVTSPRAAPSR